MKQPLGNRERCEDLLAKRERTLLCVAGDSAQKLQESRQGKIQADISNYEYFHRSWTMETERRFIFAVIGRSEW